MDEKCYFTPIDSSHLIKCFIPMLLAINVSVKKKEEKEVKRSRLSENKCECAKPLPHSSLTSDNKPSTSTLPFGLLRISTVSTGGREFIEQPC